MVIIGVLALIGAVIGFLMFIYDMGPDYFWEWVGSIFFSLFTAAIGAMVGGIIGFAIALSLPAKMEVVDENFNIECLQDNSSINGRFFLGSGSVNGVMKYSFYYEYGSGYKMCQLNTDNVVVNYSDSKPILIQHTTKMVDSKKAFINYFAIDMESIDYDIYVPKGTIKTNYDLDAQ